jgi:uncharacterized membrane protein
MNKKEFLAQLRAALAGIPEGSVREYLGFYGEMIDDRVEEGSTEEEAVCSLGSVTRIAATIVAETPFTHLIRERMRGERRSPLMLVLLIVGAPVWLSLLISLLAVDLSLVLSLWAVAASLWVTAAALTLSVLLGIAGCVACGIAGQMGAGLPLLGAGILLSGLGLFLLAFCVWLSKGMWLLTKWNITLIKRAIVRR